MVLRSLGWFNILLLRMGAQFFAARAYYISSANIPANLDRAEAALKELSTSIEESGDEVS
jgi:hypothetical protein